MLVPTPSSLSSSSSSKAIWQPGAARPDPLRLLPRHRLARISASVGAGGIAALLALVGTARRPSAASEPLAVEWTGCAAELRGPICEVTGDQLLTVWVPGAGDGGAAGCAAVVSVDGRIVGGDGEPVQGGRRHRVPVGRDSRVLSVRACGAGQPGWSLALRPHQIPAVLDEVNQQRARSPGEALARLRRVAPDLPGQFRGVAAGIEARILAATEGVDAAEPAFARAIGLSEQAGRVSDACSARLALAYFRREHLRLGEAHAVLDAGADCVASSPTQRARWPYYHAIAALEEPDIRGAAGLLERAIALEERLGLADDLAFSRQQQARVLALLGRFDESVALLGRALADTGGCERALVRNELGWTALQAEEAGRPVLARGEIEAQLEGGLVDAETCGPPSRTRPLLYLNLAFASVAAGRAGPAAAALAKARAGWQADDALARPWWLELEGHVARLRGRAAAAAASFRALDALGAARLDDHIRWRAALGLARTLEGRGERAGAIEAYRAAEASVDRELRLVPFGEGRASFAEARSPATGRLIALLMDGGRDDQAGAVARRSLQRGLRNLLRASQLLALDAPAHARWRELLGEYRQKRRELEQDGSASWRLPASELADLRRRALAVEGELRRMLDDRLRDEGGGGELRRPDRGELLLVYHPVEGGAWVGFAIEAHRTEARRLGAIDVAAGPERAAAQLLAPFVGAVRRAQVVMVLAPGALGAIDFEALPFDGRPLLAGRAVVHTLDLGEPVRPVPAPRTALVARDASGELPGAAGEAEQVVAALPGSSLLDPATDLAGLIRAIEGAEHFHYAGHGRSSGPDGLESALLVGDRVHLSSADVLTLRRVPDTVVLSGCDLARTAPTRATLGLGVGQAFVVRGARAVAAPARPVRDEDAAAFARLLYAELPAAGSFQAAVARAQLALRAERPDADWAAFRVLVP